MSSAARPLTTSELEAILLKSREKNRRLEITGLLLYKEGNFLQVLEGPDVAVQTLFETICQDSRHTGVIRLYSKPISTRDFPDWTMGFRDLGAAPKTEQEGWSDILDPSADIRTLGESQAARLVGIFKQNLR